MGVGREGIKVGGREGIPPLRKLKGRPIPWKTEGSPVLPPLKNE